MSDLKTKARKILHDFRGRNYTFGLGVLPAVADYAGEFGRTTMLVANERPLAPVITGVTQALHKKGIELAGKGIVPDAKPNTPREDVYRLESYILHYKPDCLIAIGGGSTIDAVKAANVLATLGKFNPEVEAYFGTGLVTRALRETGKRLRPFIAVQTAASSGAHLTKYANVTDPVAGQKKLIVDEAIIPDRAVFDYAVTRSMPVGLTIDGALDGIAHCLEVFFGASPENTNLTGEIAATGLGLALAYTGRIIEDSGDLEAREALGLASDLGGYAIMIGGTNGAHLTSFSLVDITSHGRACGIMNPYYIVFFAPVIEEKLRLVGEVLRESGFIETNLGRLRGRTLGLAVAEGLMAFSRSIGAPTKLTDLPGFTDEHIKRALHAAKDPQLEMKLKNMPIPLTSAQVDEFMGPILEAAKTGDLGLVKNMP